MSDKNALVKLSNERIVDNESLMSFVERAKQFCIPLFPETLVATAPEYSYGVALVSVNTKLDKSGNNKDIYKNESGGYCLHLTKINEIAQAAKLQITDSRLLERQTDAETGLPVYILHQIKWRLVSIDGSVNEGVATGEYDYHRDREKYIKEKMNEKGEKYLGGEAQVKQRRSHAGALAESKAKYRAYNDAIAKLPRSFTIEELQKPFAIPYLIKDSNAILKQLPEEQKNALLLEKARETMGLSATVYGGTNKSSNGGGTASSRIDDATYQDIPAETSKNDSNTGTIKQAEIPPDFDARQQAKVDVTLSLDDQWRELEDSLRSAPQKERTDMAIRLCEKKAVKNNNGTPVTREQFESNEFEAQIKFLRFLFFKPNKVEELPC